MTESVEETYEYVSQQVTQLHAHWKILRQLYANDEQRKLLDSKAPAFFGIIQDVLIESILLALSRLTDPAEMRSGRYQNLTLERLVTAVQGSDDEFNQSVTNALQSVQTHCQPYRTWRHRVFAHTDQPTALRTQSLPPLVQEEIEQALHSVRFLMQRIEYNLGKGDVRYEDVILKGDGNDIIFFLQQAEEFDNLQRSRDLGLQSDL